MHERFGAADRLRERRTLSTFLFICTRGPGRRRSLPTEAWRTIFGGIVRIDYVWSLSQSFSDANAETFQKEKGCLDVGLL